MGKQLKIQNMKATVVHPQDPELRVVLRRPSRKDIILYQAKVQEYESYQPAIHPETKEAIVDEQGNVRPMRLPPNYPPELMQGYLRQFVDNVYGVYDGDKQVEYTEATSKEMLDVMIEPEYDVTDTVEVEKEDPKTKKKSKVKVPVEKTFYQYLIEKLNKKETFSDPLDDRTHSSLTQNLSGA